MIKKLFSALAAAALIFAAGSCTSSEDKEQQSVCKEISAAMTQQDFKKVNELSTSLYNRLPECSVKTLGDLTMSYITLSAVGIANNDEPAVIESMHRAVDCYDEAMKKNPVEANKLWEEMASKKNDQGLSINPTEIIEIFRQQLVAYEMSLSAAGDSSVVNEDQQIDEVTGVTPSSITRRAISED